MIIVGGTYNEFCFEPRWEEKFGSGLRACRVINTIDPKIDIEFNTFGDKDTKLYLEQISSVFPKIKSNVSDIKESISFYYDHPLITPRIFPRLDTINKKNNNITIAGDDVLYFGLIEGSATVKAKRLVYDPQSPSNPVPFSQLGCKTDKLAIVTNFNEASKMANCFELDKIKEFFLQDENCDILVLKMGPKGALVIDKINNEERLIPVYKTSNVWPVGSGDVFASSFAYYWFSGAKAIEAAENASKLTAIYCSTKKFGLNLSNFSFEPLLITDIPKCKIYLAGPFFTYAERWLIDQIRNCLQNMGLIVFSPWHDIGHGMASDVVSKDLEGLDDSKLVFAVIDGLDSGTLFEVGYAIKKGIPVVAYVENESSESVKMLEGTGCTLESDLTTAIYKTFWILAKNE